MKQTIFEDTTLSSWTCNAAAVELLLIGVSAGFLNVFERGVSLFSVMKNSVLDSEEFRKAEFQRTDFY